MSKEIEEMKRPVLRLAKLPDRKLVRIAVTLPAAIAAKLEAYAAAYRDRYGEAEDVPTLIPFMLDAFIEGDRAFVNKRRWPP